MFAMSCSNLMFLFETLNSFLSNTNWYEEYLNAISRLSSMSNNNNARALVNFEVSNVVRAIRVDLTNKLLFICNKHNDVLKFLSLLIKSKYH